MSEWISVKDRFPNQDDDVLGCYFEVDMNIVGFFIYDTNKFYHYPYDESDNHISEKVTHWMLLPEPPNV